MTCSVLAQLEGLVLCFVTDGDGAYETPGRLWRVGCRNCRARMRA